MKFQEMANEVLFFTKVAKFRQIRPHCLVEDLLTLSCQSDVILQLIIINHK